MRNNTKKRTGEDEEQHSRGLKKMKNNTEVDFKIWGTHTEDDWRIW